MRSETPVVSAVRFTPACVGDMRTGLLGFVTCAVGDILRLDGVAVRRTREGRLTLSFPRGHGKYPPVRPLHDEARQALENEILGAIGLDGGGER